MEVDEFLQDSAKFAQPYRVYKNHIYVYPKHLKYDSQKSFAKVGLRSGNCILGLQRDKHMQVFLVPQEFWL